MDIVVFMLLYLVQLILFASIAHILFTDVPNYHGLYTGSKTLFDVSLGNYSFKTLQGNSKSDTLGDIFVILFLIINNILLINLLIGILASTYAIYEGRGVSLYVNGILQMRSGTEYEGSYGALVSTFPPFNFFLLPLIPFYMVKKETRPMNRKVFHMTYIPVLCFAFLLFIFTSLLLIPFAYLKSIANRCHQVRLSASASPKLKKTKVLQLVLFIFCGLFIMIANFALDCVLFFKHCY